MAGRTISETLRETIEKSGLPLLSIAREAGVQQSSLWRFVYGGQQLRSDNLDRLATYFQMELKKKRGTRSG